MIETTGSKKSAVHRSQSRPARRPLHVARHPAADDGLLHTAARRLGARTKGGLWHLGPTLEALAAVSILRGHIHVRGHKEEGTITTPFDMTVLNELDRFHLVMDTIDRLPQTGDNGLSLKQRLNDKLIEYKQYIARRGQDMPEIRSWKWSSPE